MMYAMLYLAGPAGRSTPHETGFMGSPLSAPKIFSDY